MTPCRDKLLKREQRQLESRPGMLPRMHGSRSATSRRRRGARVAQERTSEARCGLAWRRDGPRCIRGARPFIQEKYPVARDGTGTVYGTVRYGTVLPVRRASSNFPLSRAGAIPIRTEQNGLKCFCQPFKTRNWASPFDRPESCDSYYNSSKGLKCF